jgi:branched-chain amino acid transport system substrate-binding protein
VKLLVSDGYVLTSLFEEAGKEILEGAYGTAPTLPAKNLTGEGAEFVQAFAEVDPDPINVYVTYAASAAQVALDAIARSDGSREDVLAKLFEVDIDGVTGPISFDENGDPADKFEVVFQAKDGLWEFQETVAVEE